MLTLPNESFTRTETLTDADLDQVAGGFCVTPPDMGPSFPIWPPVRLPVWPPSPTFPPCEPRPPRGPGTLPMPVLPIEIRS